jgi:hypothetical protein
MISTATVPATRLCAHEGGQVIKDAEKGIARKRIGTHDGDDLGVFSTLCSIRVLWGLALVREQGRLPGHCLSQRQLVLNRSQGQEESPHTYG